MCTKTNKGAMAIFSTRIIQMVVAWCSSIHHVYTQGLVFLRFVIRLSLEYQCVWPSFISQTARKKATSSNQPFRVSAEKCVCGHSPHPSFGAHVSQRSPDQPGSQLMQVIEREREREKEFAHYDLQKLNLLVAYDCIDRWCTKGSSLANAGLLAFSRLVTGTSSKVATLLADC